MKRGERGDRDCAGQRRKPRRSPESSGKGGSEMGIWGNRARERGENEKGRERGWTQPTGPHGPFLAVIYFSGVHEKMHVHGTLLAARVPMHAAGNILPAACVTLCTLLVTLN